MRILLVDKFYEAFGGVGTYLRLAEGLLRGRGHEVFRFGCVRGAGPAGMPAFHDFEKAGDLPRLVHNAEAADKLDALLRRQKIDVAFLQNIYHHLTPAILPVLRRRRVGVVMRMADYRLACPTKHFMRKDGLCQRCLPNRFYHAASPRCAGVRGVALAIECYVQRLTRRYQQGVDVFICPTRFMRRTMVTAGLPRDKTVLLRNLVSPIALPKGLDEDGAAVLYVGRFSDEKGNELLIDLAAAMPRLRVLLAGDGPLEEALRKQAARRCMGNVTFLGNLDHAALGPHLARAAAVVVTSRCMENSPMSMLEAMRAGKCVVVPDQPSLREWVHDGRTGRLYRSGDAASLVEAVKDALAHPDQRRRMGEAAAELVGRRHDESATVRRLEELFEKAVRRCASQ
ncbi:MAG: glycosyltransferase family 4 protein [Planctomycetaceae bacterium]|nr:glycosyltransferase family 4 protein [Planctomycetaceae bacterium]